MTNFTHNPDGSERGNHPITMEDVVTTWVSAVRVAIPQSEEATRGLIREINKFVYDPDFPIQLAPYYYSEFIDEDWAREPEVTDRHEAFDQCEFAAAISDLWTLVTVLHRNGENQMLRDLQIVLDSYIVGVDCTDSVMNLDF